jgi:hypothetical protein
MMSNIAKVTYVLTDVDGDDLRWEDVAQNTEILVNADSVMLATTEIQDEYELIVRLRSRVAKPTQHVRWKLRRDND